MIFKIISKDTIRNLEDSLKSYFLNRSKNLLSIKTSKELQNQLIIIQSHLMISFFQETKDSCQSEIFDNIQSLYDNFGCYLDSNEKEFQEGLEGNFQSRVFELIIANLISQSGFELVKNASIVHKKGKKSATPDLWSDGFFIECKTNNSSLIHDWDNLLPYFDKYFDVVKQILVKRNTSQYEHPCISLAQIWYVFSGEEIESMALRLGSPIANLDKTISEWILLNHHVRCYFEHLIPNELKQQLNEINIKRTDSRKIDYQFISRRIIDSIVEKIQKKYFQDSRGILAISVSFIIQGLQLSEQETKNLVEYFCTNYFNILLDIINNKNSDNKQLILRGLNNLVAFILDTNWYNWFPSILKKHAHINLSSPYQNDFLYLLFDPRYSESHEVNLARFVNTIQYRLPMDFLSDSLYQSLHIDKSEFREAV